MPDMMAESFLSRPLARTVLPLNDAIGLLFVSRITTTSQNPENGSVTLSCAGSWWKARDLDA